MARFYRSDEEKQELEATGELNNPSLDDETFNKKYTAHVNAATRSNTITPKTMGDFHRAEDNIAGARNHAKIQAKGDDGTTRNYADERTAKYANVSLESLRRPKTNPRSGAAQRPVAKKPASSSKSNNKPKGAWETAKFVLTGGPDDPAKNPDRKAAKKIIEGRKNLPWYERTARKVEDLTYGEEGSELRKGYDQFHKQISDAASKAWNHPSVKEFRQKVSNWWDHTDENKDKGLVRPKKGNK